MGGKNEYFMTTDSFYDARPQSELRKGNLKSLQRFSPVSPKEAFGFYQNVVG